MSSRSEIYIGLMSGTSLDGIDIAIVDFTDSNPTGLHCHTQPYPEILVQRIRNVIQADRITIDQLCKLDVNIARTYADVVNQTLSALPIELDKIRAIGCHGQTIQHKPNMEPAYTLQIGDPNTLSALTGLTTVADFRRRDIALGGQGAPLAPGFHQSMFRTLDCNRVIINIGGIANITLLPADADKPALGFDTGPGNTLLDYWIQKHLGNKYDNKGKWAASGQIVDELLQAMQSDEDYFSQKPPKSTGTEYFSPDWINAFSANSLKPVDVQATLLELTATTIIRGIQQLDEVPDECYVCGGGVHNQQLMRRLQSLFPDTTINSTCKLQIDPDYVEAFAFAWLARQTINGQPGNLPSATNAREPAVLGAIFQGNRSILM